MDTLSPALLASRREALGLTRGELAEKANVVQSTLWRIETGKMSGTASTWNALLSALRVAEQDAKKRKIK